MAKRCRKYSGVGGQAVLEGIMMKNGENYAVAVRKPDGEIALDVETYRGLFPGKRWKELPFLRGIFSFIESLILGNKCLNYSAVFYEDGEQDEKNAEHRTDKLLDRLFGKKAEKVLTTLVMLVSILLAIGIFVVLPYYIASWCSVYVRNRSLIAILEGIVRILIFVLYVWGISAMKEIRRLYQYHGAEHKCINCIERGRELTVKNVMRSSRLHKRCGTSFIFFVMFVSIILFFFIQTENPLQKVALRVALMPVIAGISYELIRIAGRKDNILVNILSAPGMWIQKLTTREPDEGMVEVAIEAVEAVFDWRAYQKENFERISDGEKP